MQGLFKKTYMTQKMRVGVKAAWITSGATILATVLIIFFSNSQIERNNSAIQNVEQQKVDSGSINNNNAGRDMKVENNTYSITPQNIDSIDKLVPTLRSNSKQSTIKEQTNVKSINQSGGQTAKEIINNY